MSNIEVEPVTVSSVEHRKVDIADWPRLRRENALDYQRTLKPLFEDLEHWRRLSAKGKAYSPLPKPIGVLE